MPLLRTEWLIDPEAAYLNHGGFGALPLPVWQAAEQLRRLVESNPTDALMHRWQSSVDDVRRQVAALVGARTADAVFVANATSGTATVLASLPWQPGDEIVTTDHRYPAVASQVAALAATRGVVVREAHVPVDVDKSGEVVDRVLAEVTRATRLVVVDHIASPTGFVFPAAELTRATKDAGLPILIDGAHVPGQLPVDLDSFDPDFWVGNLHKWVCSPRACAVLRVAARWQDTVRPLVASHDYALGYQPAFDWVGTLDPVPLLAVPAALDFWDTLGWDDVRREQRALVGDGARHVADRLGTRVAVADEFTAAMRLVELPRHMSLEEQVTLAARLTDEHGVTAHLTSHAESTYVRVCGQIYNRPDDYDRLASALRGLLQT